MNLKERLLDASFQDDNDGGLLQEARDRIIELEESEKLSFEEWFEQSDEDSEYISISRAGWYAGQENY